MSNAALKQDPGGQTPTAPEPDQSLLDDLKAQATAKYSVKDYDAAAELYSQATELQDKLNGEMSPLNADLLYAYGRCLYHLAVKKSDLLGSKLPGEEVEGASSAKNKKKGDKRERTASTDDTKRIDEEVVSEIVQENSSRKEPESSNKPFVFTGDENFTDSEEDDAVEDEDEEPEDDFANAYEILDTSRILLRKRLEAEESADATGKSTTDSTKLRNLKERLADTHDLQAEILLEGERFPQAVDDLRAALDLKLALFPQENSLIAEAHYKLSLALEFSSVTREKDDNGEPKPGTSGTIDEVMREEAAKQMECAIASCELRISKEKARLGTPEQTASKAEIEDVKEMVKEMQDRLTDLRQPPVSMQDPRGTGTIDGADPQGGVLGKLLGESPAEIRARLEAASNEAKDLTGLVKKKKAATNGTAGPTARVKRKEIPEEAVMDSDTAKKPRFNGTEEAEETKE